MDISEAVCASRNRADPTWVIYTRKFTCLIEIYSLCLRTGKGNAKGVTVHGMKRYVGVEIQLFYFRFDAGRK
jgi:hypothetical protein